MQKIAIIVPCYNEYIRMKSSDFTEFLLVHPDVTIVFVNDGSKDQTLQTLESIQRHSTQQVEILNLEKNRGKAMAVIAGIRSCATNETFTHIGYLDADLSTSLDEYYRLYSSMVRENLDYVFGSRIKLMQATIRRSFWRHLIGRSLATLIDWKFKLGIYDTQCGAKCFRHSMMNILTKEDFKTDWFFDVEIFLRIKKSFPVAKGMEIPLTNWTDPGKSKLNLLHFPSVLGDLFALMNNYRSQK